MWTTLLSAWAGTLPLQGVMVDANGLAVSGSRELEFALSAPLEGGGSEVVWTGSRPVDLVDGAFAAWLDLDTAADARIASDVDLSLQVRLQGGTWSAPVPLGWAPRAAYARVAESARSLTGVLAEANLPAYVARTDRGNTFAGGITATTGTFSGAVTAPTFSGSHSGSGAGLTGIPQAAVTNLTSTLATYLPLAGGALSGGLSGTTGAFSGAVSASSFAGSGAGLTGLPAANLTGTVPAGNLPNDVLRSGVAATPTANWEWRNGSTPTVTITPSTGAVTATSFSGSGAGLTGIPQAAVTNLTATLATYLPLAGGALSGGLSGTTGSFSGAMSAASFSGSGAGLTSLPAANLTGTVPVGALPSDVLRSGVAATPTANWEWRNGSTPTVTVTPSTGAVTATSFSGSGAGLTGIPQGAITGLSGALGSYLPTGGGTMSGALRLGANVPLQMGSYAADPTGLNAAAAGSTWYNSATGTLRYWDGATARDVGPAKTFQAASASSDGFLTSADWSTFNGKQAAGSYLTALNGDVTAAGPGTGAAVVARLRGTPLASTPPASGQVLGFDGSNWTPTGTLGTTTVRTSSDAAFNLQTTDNGWLYTQWLESNGTRRTWMGLDNTLASFNIVAEGATTAVNVGASGGVNLTAPTVNISSRLAVGGNPVIAWQELSTPVIREFAFSGLQAFNVSLPGIPAGTRYILADVFATASISDHQVFELGRGQTLPKSWVEVRGQQPSLHFGAMRHAAHLVYSGESDGFSANYGMWYGSQMIPVNSNVTVDFTNYGNSGSTGWIYMVIRLYSF